MNHECEEWCHCRTCGGFKIGGVPYGPSCSCLKSAKEKAEEIANVIDGYITPVAEDTYMFSIEACGSLIERALIEARCEGLREAAEIHENYMNKFTLCDAGCKSAIQIRQRADEISKELE